jgi:hypothetical protein
MPLHRLADGVSTADIEGMTLDPQASDPNNGFQSPRDLSFEPASDEQDPATPGGPSPYNGAEPVGKPVTTDPMWNDPANPDKKPPYSPLPYVGPGPSVDVTTLHNARRAPMEETMTIDLWTEASRDLDADMQHERAIRAKIASAALWPFVSAAMTEDEFGHRMALCEDDMAELFPDADFRTHVAKAIRQDYLILKGADVEDLWEDFHKTAADEPDEAPAGGSTGAGNPNYFAGGQEAGPNTGSDGQYPQFPAGPDPVDPMNGLYPMQPGHWSVPPNAGWVERPMNFGEHRASAGYVDEGVQTGPGPNPDYFAGGSAGVAGDQQNGFPADVSLPEPDERVDMYGKTPQSSTSAPPVSYSNTPKQASIWVMAEKDNHGACAGCNTPVYREGDVWKHLGGDPGHGVRLHEDHPWIVAQQGNRVMASTTREARDFSESERDDAAKSGHALSDGSFPIYSAKDVENAKGLIGRSKHDRSTVVDHINHWAEQYGVAKVGDSKTGARWVTADVSSTDTSMGDSTDQSSTSTSDAPTPPPSMEAGGPGSMAGSPMTIPNDQTGSNPFATGGGSTPGGTPGAGSMPGGSNPFTAVHHQAESIGRSSDDNPSGVESGDEYDANNWDAPVKQRPRQNAEERHINTPQRQRQGIPTNSSDGNPGEEEDEDEEERG